MASRTPRIRRILVALGHVERPSRALLRKAAAIARATGSSVELFHADASGRSGPESASPPRESSSDSWARLCSRAESHPASGQRLSAARGDRAASNRNRGGPGHRLTARTQPARTPVAAQYGLGADPRSVPARCCW